MYTAVTVVLNSKLTFDRHFRFRISVSATFNVDSVALVDVDVVVGGDDDDRRWTDLDGGTGTGRARVVSRSTSVLSFIIHLHILESNHRIVITNQFFFLSLSLMVVLIFYCFTQLKKAS